MTSERRCIKGIYLGWSYTKLDVLFHSSSSARTWTRGYREPKNFSPADGALCCPCKPHYDGSANSVSVTIPSWERRTWLWRIAEIFCGNAAVARQTQLCLWGCWPRTQTLSQTVALCVLERTYSYSYTRTALRPTHKSSPCSYVSSKNSPACMVPASPQWNRLFWRSQGAPYVHCGLSYSSEEWDSPPSSHSWYCL